MLQIIKKDQDVGWAESECSEGHKMMQTSCYPCPQAENVAELPLLQNGVGGG